MILNIFFYGSPIKAGFSGDLFVCLAFFIQKCAVARQKSLGIKRAGFDIAEQGGIFILWAHHGVTLVISFYDYPPDALCQFPDVARPMIVFAQPFLYHLGNCFA